MASEYDGRIDLHTRRTRVEIGLAEETKIREALCRIGVNLEPASKYEDMALKTDAFWIDGDKKHRCSIKYRDKGGNDFLFDVFSPFRGLNSLGTKTGRDVKQVYVYCFNRSIDRKTIRMAKGDVCHSIINDMKDELEAAGGFRAGRAMYSDIHPTCQLRVHRDASEDFPKVLGFIPPTYLEEYYPKSIVSLPYHEG